jgi:hypothetical protein
MPGLAPDPRSIVVAERVACDFIGRDGGGMELVVINPTWIVGRLLTTCPGACSGGAVLAEHGSQRLPKPGCPSVA